MEPFFLATDSGRRFCVFYPPAVAVRGIVVYAHPWAEEMNKSRRMAAEMARQMARSGFAVLQLDLAGCGDSDGDFADASWDAWLEDIDRAAAWLQQRYPAAPLLLWGLRVGALLAVEYAAAHHNCSRVLLWSPVLNGEQFLTQFLRLRVANQMLAGNQQEGGTQQLLQQLQAGEGVEVAGYTLAPALALPLAQRKLGAFARAGLQIEWFELLSSAERPLPPVVEKVAQDWREHQSQVNVHKLVGEAFWNTQEITVVSALWQRSLQALVSADVI